MTSVVAVSGVAHGRPGWVEALAASPDRAREGKLWLLVSSALLVDHPLVLSLISFVALAGLAWAVCGPRMFWRSALLGQVAATLFVYVFFVGAVRWIVPGAFDSIVASPDYGVSTVSAAWLGAIATVGWRRRGRSRAGKISIALTCVAVGLFAYSVRPDLTVLTSEHLVAFALGVGAAVPGWRLHVLAALRRRLAAAARSPLAAMRAGKPPIATGAVISAFLALAIVAGPSALATLRTVVAIHLQPTVGRCAASWNSHGAAPRLLLARRQIDVVSIGTTRRPIERQVTATRKQAKWADYCRYTFTGPGRAFVIFGLWRHGRVNDWSAPHNARPTPRTRANAALQSERRVHLLHPRTRHAPVRLSS